jgi:methylmalonyl-CoA mutase cobalamin-binding subunit
MRRRKVIKVIAGSAGAWPISARAQQPQRRVVLLLGFKEVDARAKVLKRVFETELDRLGWTDGHNVRIDFSHREPHPAGIAVRAPRSTLELKY